MLLENKVVLITGASRGIGRATAIEAARQGANVAINTFRDDAVAAEVVAEVEALGRKAVVFDADVALPESAARSGTGKWREAVVLIKPAR